MTLLGAILLLPTLVWSAPKGKKTEGPSDLIEKAYNLSLQKDRSQAMHILTAALKRETPTSPAAREFKQALQEISGLFFSDKTQQLFELASSLRRTDVRQAQGKLSEALRIEPDNVVLLNESARLQMSSGECQQAADALAKQRRVSPFDEATILSAAQAAVCLSDWPSFTALRSLVDVKKSSERVYWLALEAERAIKEKSDLRISEAVDAVRREDAQYPELPYFEFKRDKEASKQGVSAQKYLMNCKNISAALSRRYMIDPFLCRRTAEVESFVKVAGEKQ